MENRITLVTESKTSLTLRLFQRHLTMLEGDPLPVTRSEFELLAGLEEHPGELPYMFGRLVVIFEW